MDYGDIRKLKAFFSALKDVYFKALNLNQVPSFTTVDGQPVPVDKIYCLGLLRNLPQFQGDQFKDDNTIVRYFSNSLNRKLILDRFSQAERIELEKFLEIKPVTKEVTEQPSEQPSLAEQAPTGEPPATMAGESPPFTPAQQGQAPLIPGFPSAPVIRPIPTTKPPVVKTPVKETVPGLKTTPETGLDFEGKPYQTEATAPIRTAGKNLASQTQIGVKKGLTKAGGEFSRILGGAGRGLGGLLSGAAGGGGRFFTRIGIGGAEALASMGTQMTRGGLSLGPSKKVGFWALGLFILFFIFALGTSISLPGQTTPSTEAAPEGTTPGSATQESLGCPTVGTISNPYGYNIPDQPDNVGYVGCGSLLRCHSGIDISSGAGTSVHATFDGIATTVGEDGVKGKYITVSNSASGYSATFEHLNSQNITQGESVKKGQVIGTMGATGIAYGAHLHYRLEKDGKLLNPFRYLGSSATIASISLIQSDDLSQNDYTGKPASFDWGRCNNVP